MNKWKDIFNNRLIDLKNNLNIKQPKTLEQLLIVSDMKITTENYNKSFYYLNTLKPKRVLEIGCGIGINLLNFYQTGSDVCGVDYAEETIETCKFFMPNGQFVVSDALNYNFDNKFDLILSNSVFQYFDNYEYSCKVIKKMLSHLDKNGICIISDLFCLDKMEEYIAFRKKELNISDYEWDTRYSGLNHLYYDKNKLKNYVESLNFGVKLVEPSFYQSGHNQFRFDLRITNEN